MAGPWLRVCFGIGSLLFVFVPIHAQIPVLRHYSIENGLPQSQVSDILQTREGFLWVGTDGGGAARFDGTTFSNYTPQQGFPDHSVYEIYQDRRGRLWFGTVSGLATFDGFSFEVFTTADGLPADRVTAIFEDRENQLWIGTNKGLCVLAGSTCMAVLPALNEVEVLSITQDRRRRYWIGTDHGVYQFDGRNLTHFTSEDGLPHNHVRVIHERSNGELWFGTNAGISRFGGDRFIRVGVDEIGSLRIWDITEDHNGVLWIGTDDGVYYSAGERFSSFAPGKFSVVWSITEDAEHNLWIGTNGAGLFMYNRTPFSRLGKENGMRGEIVMGIAEDGEGGLWFGTEYGAGRFYDQAFTNYTAQDGLAEGRVRTLAVDQGGDLWFGTDSGISRFDGRQFTTFDRIAGKLLREVRVIRQDRIGNLWFGTRYNGVLKYDGKAFTAWTRHEGLPDNTVWDIHEDRDGIIWLGTFRGLVRFDGSSFTTLTTENGLLHDSVTCIAEDNDGGLWLATHGGLHRYVPARAGQAAVIDSFQVKHGLSDDPVLFLQFDGQGALWAGTNRGLDRIDVPRYLSTGEKHIVNFDKENGFAGVEANLHAALRDSNGFLWFGTVGGVIRYEPSLDFPRVQRPRTHVTGIRLFLDTFDYRQYADSIDARSVLPAGLRLPHRENHVTFDFVGLRYRSPENIRYRYKLEGFDKTWSPPTKDRRATYSNLPAGEYKFLVQSKAGAGTWDASPAVYAFEIIPPFWETYWFLYVCTSVIGVAVWSLHRYRMRVATNKMLEMERIRLMENERVRRKAAKDFHDELGHMVTRISLFGELLKRQFELNEGSVYIDRIIETSKGLSSGMGDFLWTLNPSNDTLQDLVLRLKDFGDELFDKTGIAFRSHNPRGAHNLLKLSLDDRRHIMLLFKEAMHNVLKHAGCQNVELTVECKDNQYSITMIDDGNGFDVEGAFAGQGLGNMKGRADKLGGVLEISSSTRGTCIVFRRPYLPHLGH